MAGLPAAKRFTLVLIKPSHYDDDGYVIQWVRSSIPSNTLAALYGLAADSAERNILGADTVIDIIPIDETNTRITPKKIAALIDAAGGQGMVGLVGVQSNQYPRALDIARQLRALGQQVVIGGFHVSGCLSMLPGVHASLQEALDMGCSLYAGEAEDRLDEVLLDASRRELRPVYNYMKELPGIESTPPPFLPKVRVNRVAGGYGSFDAGRGCPFQCSFCTIINVQGRKSRHRSPDDVERIIRDNIAQGVMRFYITDDNFARNKDWEPIFDRIIHLREVEKLKIKFVIQVDTMCHKLPNFIEKAGRAGVTRVFIGMENINPENLIAAKKRQNKITEYRTMLLAWKKARAITYVGYILGFPADTPESIVRDIKVVQRELPIDVLEFFCLTPLPGSEDHQKLSREGVAMDPDLNKYDLDHVVTGHAKMSQAEWEKTYELAWNTYYTPEHFETVMRRAAASRISIGNVLALMLWFYHCILYEGVHPLEGGFLRRKYRADRRPGLPREAALGFWARYTREMAVKHWGAAKMLWRYERVRRRIKNDPNRLTYMDTAMHPVEDNEDETLDLLTQTDAARAAVVHMRKVERLTAGARA